MLDNESGDDAKNKQRAEFFMGKTLYQMGFYAGSLAYFDRSGLVIHADELKSHEAINLCIPLK